MKTLATLLTLREGHGVDAHRNLRCQVVNSDEGICEQRHLVEYMCGSERGALGHFFFPFPPAVFCPFPFQMFPEFASCLGCILVASPRRQPRPCRILVTLIPHPPCLLWMGECLLSLGCSACFLIAAPTSSHPPFRLKCLGVIT